MSAYYDLLEKPDIRRTGEQQPLYARFVAKGDVYKRQVQALGAIPLREFTEHMDLPDCNEWKPPLVE